VAHQIDKNANKNENWNLVRQDIEKWVPNHLRKPDSASGPVECGENAGVGGKYIWAEGEKSNEILKKAWDNITRLNQIGYVGLKSNWCQILTGCCPNKNLFERSLKRFLFINLGEVKEVRFQLFEPEGRVLESPEASFRFIKKRFRASEKWFGQQPVELWICVFLGIIKRTNS